MIRKINAADTWALRQRVMWPDQPVDYIKLKDDGEGIHFGFFNQDQLVSVVSLFIDGSSAQFRKFATEVNEQGKGFGGKLLVHMMEEALNRQVNMIWCNARLDKAPFYEKFGMIKTGSHFMKDGIAFVVMQKDLLSG